MIIKPRLLYVCLISSSARYSLKTLCKQLLRLKSIGDRFRKVFVSSKMSS